MKKYFYIVVLLLMLSSCSISTDLRDKFVGEYSLSGFDRFSGEYLPYGSYNWVSYSDTGKDIASSLIIEKDLNDSLGLIFTTLKDFDFANAERIKAQNEEIKRENKERNDYDYEELYSVPKPTYDDKRDLIDRFEGYIENGKIIIRDFERSKRDRGYGVDESYMFDSVVFKNDTLTFCVQHYYTFYSNYTCDGKRKDIIHYTAIRSN